MWPSDNRFAVRDQLFHSGRVRKSRYELDTWEDKLDRKYKIEDMTKVQLLQALAHVEAGYKCFGQRSKVISLEKALAKKLKVE